MIGLTWVLVYRTEKFQKLKGEVEKQSKKCKFKLIQPKSQINRFINKKFQWREGKKSTEILWINITRRK